MKFGPIIASCWSCWGGVWECKNANCCQTCRLECGCHYIHPFWMLKWVDVMSFISWNSRTLYKHPINMKTYRWLWSKWSHPQWRLSPSLSQPLARFKMKFQKYHENRNVWYERSKFMQIIFVLLNWKFMTCSELNLHEFHTHTLSKLEVFVLNIVSDWRRETGCFEICGQVKLHKQMSCHFRYESKSHKVPQTFTTWFDQILINLLGFHPSSLFMICLKRI